MTKPINASTWISEVLYKRIPSSPGVEETRYLAIFTQKGDRALLYEGIPSNLPGLLQAGLGGRSVGKAYNKLVKGKFPYQEVVGEEKVRELRRIMVL